MSDYDHASHAGNHGDVLKHCLLCLTIDELLRDPSPITYIETHAGAGLYDLNDAPAVGQSEYLTGIGALDFPALPVIFNPYRQSVEPWLKHKQYPGSPLIASQLLRDNDQLILFENDDEVFKNLNENLTDHEHVVIKNQNGFESIVESVADSKTRNLVLIDPAYVDKSDYLHVVETVNQIASLEAKFIALVWYPIIDRRLVDNMLKKLKVQALWQFELDIKQDSTEGQMTGSGMIVVNPPDDIAKQMTMLLPELKQQLASDTNGT